MPNVLQFRPTSPEADAHQRALALDTRRSFIVEAPAGSGKTGLLVQRLLKLLLEDSVERPEDVLAMTFTRKATAEMQERVLQVLLDANNLKPLSDPTSPFELETRSLALAVLDRSQALGWDLLAQPQRLNIRSILSVCMEIANSLPLLSESTGTQDPVEAAAPLYNLAARRTLLQLGSDDQPLHDALLTILLHRDGNLADCQALIANMLGARDQWGELVPLSANLDHATLDHQVRSTLERSLRGIITSALTRVHNLIPSDFLQFLTAFAARNATLPGYEGAPSPIAFCQNLTTTPSPTPDHLDHWRALIALVLKPSDGGWRKSTSVRDLGCKPAKPDLEALKQLIAHHQSEPLRHALHAILHLPPATYPEDQWHVAKALFFVLSRALAELKVLFAERNACDFTEAALAARTALLSPDGPADVALATGGRLRHLLVDEMQDTSSSQYELIRLLTHTWDGSSQTLFLVGDPKQSIYLFRQARVERFLRTMREARLGDVPLTPIRLTSNFRSQAALVSAFNHDFSLLFPPPNDPSLTGTDSVDVPFVAAVPTRPQTQPESILWHPVLLTPADPGQASPDYAQLEAQDLRLVIERRLTTPLPAGRTKPWSIAILARARGHLSAILQELKAHDGKPSIPFRAIDLDPLSELPEVLDLLALTRALLHPSDRVAWLAVLRSPLCGLTLADLLLLTGKESQLEKDTPVADLIADRVHDLSPTGQLLLNRLWPVLDHAVNTLGQDPLSVHLERLWRTLGGDLVLTPERLSNALRYLALLRELEANSGTIDLAVLTSRLADLYAEPTAADNIQLDILTIHKSKGLEWDLVLVPGLHRRPRGAGSLLLNWLELDAPQPDQEPFLILAPIWGKGKDSDLLNDWLRSIRSRRQRAEDKRLFYVAATRAKEELHLFAACTLTTKQELAKPAVNSLLGACWPAAEAIFTALHAAQSEPSESEEPIPFPQQPEPTILPLAAAAEPVAEPAPILQRVPLAFDPAARFLAAQANRLTCASTSAVPQAPAFARPEGSFAVRAFGNVVHRFLQLLSTRLETTPTAALLDELPTWQPRLLASLRAEGIPPTLAASEATRALRALTSALNDPIGLWILSPHPAAASEAALTDAQLRSLRADRTFLAGPTPLSAGADSLWIVDFKTGEQGSRSTSAFEAAELTKYRPQLEAYAGIRRSITAPQTTPGHPIQLALYYPLIPRLITWTSTPAY